VKVASEPEALLKVLGNPAYDLLKGPGRSRAHVHKKTRRRTFQGLIRKRTSAARN
jgi:hypothetical protein